MGESIKLTRTSVRHAQQIRLRMLDLKVLILKLLSIDRLPTRSISSREISSLAHKLLNHSVEAGALVVKRLAGNWAVALLAGAERAEVLGGLWDDVAVELEDNASGWLVVQRDVEEHLWAGGVGWSGHCEFGLSWGLWLSCEWERFRFAIVTLLE